MDQQRIRTLNFYRDFLQDDLVEETLSEGVIHDYRSDASEMG
jgi:hypothetical protein